MTLNAYESSAGVFVRGLSNLKTQLAKAKAHAAASGRGEAVLLNAPLAADHMLGTATHAPRDLHMYTLAAHVHWAAQGATLAIERLLNVPAVPATNDAKSFADLEQRLDATIAYLRGIAPRELEVGLERTIVIEQLASTSSSGARFLIAFAIPHFYYHVTTAYGILRNQGVQLTMGDFLGNWGTS